MLTLFDDLQVFDDGKKRIIHFDIPDADLTLRQQFFDKEKSDNFYEILLHTIPWQQNQRKMYDKVVDDPRLTAWYGKKAFNQWTDELLEIKEEVEIVSGSRFNNVLLNYYRDGNDSVSWHSDKKPEGGTNTPIASVSFGETRAFQIRHKFNKDLKPMSIPLTHGSFLLMAVLCKIIGNIILPKPKRKSLLELILLLESPD
ncbi:alpha-ketoglutarate-dependent dioxygenase AlkB family protein [Ferruginibacter albus]|uniref:alpha-ketoglutarate-dependent dioxygenase AlkB family protein n=1 Tax=Ferruginibacter albus TaxID=2875540 RepID=UPI001CC37C2E|nr:alpha-ketoglutarate-dependent dioxygenase AlkB [Ferruginibacter albus]UAY52864.1 alpha-ketoglutarate-dependent dioxygenase AlkB [Ferruginibacter albus]